MSNRESDIVIAKACNTDLQRKTVIKRVNVVRWRPNVQCPNSGFQQFNLENVNERTLFFQQMNESINRIQGYLPDFSQMRNNIEQRSSSADESHAPLTIEQDLLAICKKNIHTLTEAIDSQNCFYVVKNFLLTRRPLFYSNSL